MTKKKTSRKGAAKTAAGGRGAPKKIDPRAPIEPKPANLNATLSALEAVLAKLTPPEAPQPGDLVDVLMHSVFGVEIPCGMAQAAVQRIDEEFVDRNEYRVTEAFEVEQLLADLELPGLFQRCLVAQQTIGQVYNDQNGVDLQYLREATISERKSLFQRLPAIPTHTVRYLSHFIAFEEIMFSPRSTQRVQARLGLESKTKDVEGFIVRARELLAPFGHIPHLVGEHPKDGGSIAEPALCPACLLVRLAPPGKG